MKALRFAALTTIELILVITLMSLVTLGSLAAIVNFHTTTVIDAELKTAITNIQRARQLAISNSTSQNYSIKFLADSYVLFPGDTYVEGSGNNINFYLDSAVIVSTTFPSDQIIFQNFTGRVISPGSVDLTAGSFAKQITINSLGVVEQIN